MQSPTWFAATALAALVAGCYAPAPPEGLACSPAGRCPDGQRCVEGTCQLGVPDDDARCDPLALVGRVEARLGPDVVATGGEFGRVVAVQDPWIAIGAPAAGSGAALIYERTDDGVVQRARLVVSDVAARFGAAVALGGGRVVVGAPAFDDGVGLAQVYDLDLRLTDTFAPEVDARPAFGAAVAAWPGGVAVGAPAKPGGGAVYLYEEVAGGGALDEPVLLGPAEVTEGFGAVLAASDEILAIGAPSDDDAGVDAGRVTLLRRVDGAWLSIGRVEPDDLAAEDGFGGALAVHGTTVYVGAPGHGGTGAVYVVDASGSPRIAATVVSSIGSPNDLFGAAVAADGDYLLVGAPGRDGDVLGAGAAFAFRRQGGELGELAPLLDPEAGAVDQLGSAVAIGRAGVVVTSPLREADARGDVGSALALDLVCPDEL